jgi:ATP-dependent helicase/nuclease subunit B
MTVRFILGRSGTGKTSYCIKEIVNALLASSDNQQLILLVPEQATYQAERAILSDKRIAGYSRLNVLSFDRLQFMLSGRNAARPTVSRIGRQMIIHRILRDRKSDLKVFGASAEHIGLGRQMAETVTELHQYAKTPEDVRQLAGKLDKDRNLAALKFADIAMVLEEYLKFVEGKFIDPDVQLNRVVGAVRTAAFARGAKLWVDGFASFTAGELAILAELLKAAADVRIALCLDPSKINLTNPDAAEFDITSLFYSIERTYAGLVEIIKKSKLKLDKPVILDRPVRFSDCEQIGHIERNLFEPQPGKMPAADNIRIMSAADARAEVRFVAGEIVRLVREGNCRYRDIAVIASDIESYQHYIRAYFEDYNLPFFIDRRRPLNQHPAVQLICSALQAATGGFSNSDIFAYLKTDLVSIGRSDVDVLENYCLAFGVGGSDWQSSERWNFQDKKEQRFDENRINQIRLEVGKPLLILRDRLAGAVTAKEFTNIIFDFLEELGAGERIGRWIEDALGRGDYAAAEEHQQFYGRLVDVLDELAEVFGGQQLGCQDYIAILTSAFSQMTLAFIPPKLDQVLVGSIERSRHPDLKAVFLIGATQKQFPVPVGYCGVLTDDDRIMAESADFALAGSTAQALAERQYLAYIAFTRPSKFLYVTYPLADDKGRPMMRSQFIDNLESLFENLAEESITDGQIDVEKVSTENELADLLCGQLGKDISVAHQDTGGKFDELLDAVCRDGELAEAGLNITSAINYDNIAVLGKEVAGEFFGWQITSSATELGTFAKCPYQYFARYILGLKKRQEFKFEPLDVGIFYHNILDDLLKRLNTEKKDFAKVQDGELLELLGEEISKFVLTDTFVSNFLRRSKHNRFIVDSACEVLGDCVSVIAEMVRAGGFRPILSEVSFGEVKGVCEKLGEYKLTLPDGRALFLNGKIDRLDVAEINGRKVTVVFDYKRRSISFSWSWFYHGLDMQLPIYMLAVRNAADSQCRNVAGAFYMPVETGPEKTCKAKGIFNGEFFQQLDGTVKSRNSRFYNFQVSKENGQYGNYGKSGALKPEDFEKVFKITEGKIVELVGEILSGRIDVRPYRLGTATACSYCDYKAVCRFDWLINDRNLLEVVSKAEVLESIE